MTGFTKLDNDILEEIQKYKFNLNELKIIMCIWRFTYGFNREDHAISLSFFENHTGLSRGRLNKSLKDLLSNKVILKTDEGNASKSNSYSFNKNFEEWKTEKYSSFSSVQNDTSSQVDTSVQNGTATSVQDDTATSVRNDTQERKIKENSKEKMIDQKDKPNPFGDFEKLFGYLPSGIFMNQLNDWIDNSQFQDPEAIICETIKRAKLQTPNNPPAYINSVLKKLHDLGLFTLAAVQEYNANFDRKIQSKKKNVPRSLFEQGEESRRRQNEPFELSPEEEAEIDAMLPF
jgi:phage replication O-like protein O